jgi:3-oxoadipate CoA-transferase alpha subunit
VALVHADQGDRWGNLAYSKTAMNFNPVMAMAAQLTIASVRELVPLGALAPERVDTPGLFVQRLVQL